MKVRSILLLGSGLMAESVVSHLLRRPQNRIHIASNIVQDAKKIADKKGNQCTYGVVDVQSPHSLKPLVQKAQIVISYVPAFLHMHVAKVCVQLGKHLVTASYVSNEMKGLDGEVKSKGLIFLNELGLDPGIDHLATMKIIEEVAAQGGKILQYESWCGGLPSPESCDNPLGYKFTWSPIGAFRALKNKAVFIDNNQQVEIQPNDLLYFGETLEINQALTLEGYPNRNSIAYKELYNLKDACKVLRGTLRYKGFCEIINAFKEIGVMDETPVKGQTWVDYLTFLLEKQPGNTLQQKIKFKSIDNVKQYAALTQHQKNKKFNHIIKAFKFFDLLNPTTMLYNQNISNIQNLIKLLQPKLSLKEGETDLIAMQHKFVIELKGRKFVKKSSLIKIGQKNGQSAMSVTVGTPTAIGAQLILDNKISERGVIIPIHKDIYIPVLQQLEKVGVRLFDIEEDI